MKVIKTFHSGSVVRTTMPTSLLLPHGQQQHIKDTLLLILTYTIKAIYTYGTTKLITELPPPNSSYHHLTF